MADSLVSSASRRLTLRKRPDLSARYHYYQGYPYWVVKEPVGLKYFRFQEEEYAILHMLDGKTSFEKIKEQFESEFAPQKITLEDLQHFIGMLHRSGLVIADAPGQGKQLKKRRDENFKRELMSKLSNVLAIRFKGIDPEWILNRIYPFIGWFFRWYTVTCVMMLAISALILLGVKYETFQQRLPAFHEFFGPSNWIWLGTTMALTKVLHEFGHGLSCKHFGGECHEMGVMVLVLTPCLYCNVSDSWLLPNKWHRAAIGAAGIYVELFLASTATFLWWFSEPGLLNHICLSLMFICSVSTILFNGNPLLRFDGYYILADIVEIPNLRQKSTKILNRLMCEYCLGMEQQEDPFLPQGNQLIFATYTVAAVIYRWIVVFSILFFLNQVLEPYGLKAIGQAIAMMSLFGLVGQPGWKLWKFFSTPGRLHQVKKKNFWITVSVVSAMLFFVCAVPLPRRLKCSLRLIPQDPKTVVINVPGKIDHVEVQQGDLVEEGQLLATLKNEDLQYTIHDLRGEIELAEKRRLQLVRRYDPDDGLLIKQVQETLDSLKAQLREKEQDLAKLEIHAPVSGKVYSPPPKPQNPNAEDQLPTWTGNPLEKVNADAVLTMGDTLCQIGDPKKWNAILIVDQVDIPFIALDQKVRIMLDAYPGTKLPGQIKEISQGELEVAPANMSIPAGGGVATRTDAAGVQRPLSTSYEAKVPLDDIHGELWSGMRGRAKVSTRWETLASRLRRLLARTFHFQL